MERRLNGPFRRNEFLSMTWLYLIWNSKRLPKDKNLKKGEYMQSKNTRETYKS
jgi:hypothetical protein